MQESIAQIQQRLHMLEQSIQLARPIDAPPKFMGFENAQDGRSESWPLSGHDIFQEWAQLDPLPITGTFPPAGPGNMSDMPWPPSDDQYSLATLTATPYTQDPAPHTVTDEWTQQYQSNTAGYFSSLETCAGDLEQHPLTSVQNLLPGEGASFSFYKN